MFVARSFFSCLHQVPTVCTLGSLSDGSRSTCPVSVILLSLTICDGSLISALFVNSLVDNVCKETQYTCKPNKNTSQRSPLVLYLQEVSK